MVSLCFGLVTILLAWAVDCLKRGGDVLALPDYPKALDLAGP